MLTMLMYQCLFILFHKPILLQNLINYYFLYIFKSWNLDRTFVFQLVKLKEKLRNLIVMKNK